MEIRENCDGLKQTPLWLLFTSIFVFCHLSPLLYFYINWYSRYKIGDGDINIGASNFYIPSISKTWRNFNAVFPVFTGAIIIVSVYSVCLVETGNILCLLLAIALAIFVFSFNDETGPISVVHGVFAFGFFCYLLWLVYALSIYVTPGTIWWWPYIPMGISIVVLVGYSIYSVVSPGKPYVYVSPGRNKNKESDVANEHWPSVVSFFEHLFIFSFEIYLLTIQSTYQQ